MARGASAGAVVYPGVRPFAAPRTNAGPSRPRGCHYWGWQIGNLPLYYKSLTAASYGVSLTTVPGTAIRVEIEI